MHEILGMPHPLCDQLTFRESFLREMLLSYRSAKVFSLENFPLYGIVSFKRTLITICQSYSIFYPIIVYCSSPFSTLLVLVLYCYLVWVLTCISYFVHPMHVYIYIIHDMKYYIKIFVHFTRDAATEPPFNKSCIRYCKLHPFLV